MNDEAWDVVIADIKKSILKRIDTDLDNEASSDEIAQWCEDWTVPQGGGDRESLIAAIAIFIHAYPDR